MATTDTHEPSLSHPLDKLEAALGPAFPPEPWSTLWPPHGYSLYSDAHFIQLYHFMSYVVYYNINVIMFQCACRFDQGDPENCGTHRFYRETEPAYVPCRATNRHAFHPTQY